MSSKQKKSIHMGLDSDSSDDSDFDEDDDPDKIEVPGGFKSMGSLGSMPNLDEPGTSKAPKSFQSIAKPLLPGTSLLRPVKKEQPGYEVVPIPPGSNLFGPRIVKMGPGGPFPMDQMRAMVANGVPHMAGIQQLINMNKLLPNANPLVGMRIPFNPADPASYFSGVKPDEDGTVEEDEDLGVVETYADYMPSKLKLGVKHPDPVVETATLSSVAPPEIWYQLSLPQETIKTGALSALQLEAIVYACQQHENFLGNAQRAGFLVGDGAGVGKGRTIAGLIFENYLKGRKRAIWVSISNDLKYDAERDLGDIGAGKIPVYAINKFKYAKISSDVNGNVKKGVLFSTYSSLIGESQSNTKYKTRLKQILQWCGEDFDGLIVFDECHRAKNLAPSGSSKPTKTGLTVLELQNKLPKARVVYASATGASEPKNMAYMVRLGLWGPGTPFPQFTDFINTVDKRGIGAMEIVAMEMKLRGMYIARQLSFHGVTFKVDEVPLSKDFVKMYDDAVKLWVELMQKFTEAVEMVAAEAKMRKHMWSQFWSAHQRFFKYLCIAAKVKHAVRVAREAVKVGKCVVIGLQSTGEARTLDQLERDEGELSDFVSTAKGVLQTLIEKHFPAPDRNRVLKLLGLPYHQKTVLDELGINVDQESSSSNGKRKPVRTASLITSKKMKLELNDSDDSEPDGKKGSDSEFEVNSDDEESEENSDGGSNSDDFNPFGGGDDSDDVADPWLVRSKKKKKTKTKQNKKNGKTAKLKKSEPVSAPVRLPTANRLQISLPPKPAAAKEAAPNPDMGVASVPTQAMLDKAWAMKEEMLSKLEYLGPKLPANTLDQLIDELGGPENVAEMTGRKGRVIQNEDGQIQYESRSETGVPLETLNITEKQRFMDGDKDVAIISEAASSGISLQADRRAINQKRRVHITLELPWSADRAIQQFGRTHRSNQVSAPEYLFLISDLAGERRFASIVAKRLESMGALTHGDRRATESRDLSQFNIDNRYGRAALEATMKAIMGYETPVVPPPEDYKGNFFHDVAVGLVGVGLIVNNDAVPGSLTFDKDYYNISKFLNRILGMPVDLQNRLFKYFTDTLNAIIKQAKRAGRYDMGILDLGSGSENVKQKKLYKFVRRTTTGSARIELHIVEVERGMAFEEAKEKWGDLFGSNEGFYISKQPFRSGRRYAYLAVSTGSSLQRRLGEKSEQHQLFTLYKPNLGQNLKPETLLEVRKNYKLVTPDEAEPVWNELYDMAKTTCTHTYQNGSCKSRVVGLECQVGLRQRTFNVLCGSVLSVWSKVEELVTRSGFNQKMQVVRMRSEGGTKIVGVMIPDGCLQELITIFAKDAESTSEKQF